jgi:surface protein
LLGGETLEKVSTTDSDVPVYAWYDDNDQTLYYYSQADVIDMNTSAQYMFYYLTKLEEVDLEGIETSSATTFYYMFYGDSSLKNLDLSTFDTSSVTNMNYMFQNCSSLQDLNLDNWSFIKSYNSMSSMFYNANNLKTLSAKNWIIPESFLYRL